MDDLLLVRMSHAEVVHKPLFHEGGLRGALVERAFYAAGDDTDGGSAAALSARWDPNDAAHVVVAEASGALRSVRALDGSDGALATSLTRYQLHRKGTALNRPWEQVELVPKVPGGLLFFQRDSNKLLYSTLEGLNLPEGRSCKGGSPPDAPSSRVFCVGQHPGPLSRMAVRPDGALVAAGTAHGSLRLWRLADGTATAAEAAAHGGAVTAVAFSGEFTVATGGDDGAVRVWLPDALGRLRLLHQLHTMGDAPVRCLTVYSSLLLKRVRCGDFLPDAPPPSEHRSVLEAMADAPVHSGAGDLLAVGTDDGTLHVWKAAAMTATSVHDGTVWRVACVDHDPKGWAVTHVAIRSDGKQVVAAATNTAHERPSVHEGVYRAYDTTTFAQCQEMSTLRAPVAAEFATSPLFRHRRTLLACTAAGPPRLLDASMLEVHERGPMATTEAERATTTDRLATEMPVELTADQHVDQQVAAAAEHAQAWLPSVAALREHGVAAVNFTSAAAAAEPWSPPSRVAVDVNASTGADEDKEAEQEMNGQLHVEELDAMHRLGVDAHQASSAGKPSAREGRDQVVATAKAAAMTAAMTALAEAEHAQAQWQARPAPPRQVHTSKGRPGTKRDAKDAKGAAAVRVERVVAPATAVAVAAMQSTALLGNKLQRTRDVTFDAATATATARGSRALATAVATEVAGSTATHYTGLANVDIPVVGEVARKVGKQLNPKWVSANAAATPVLGDLWNVLERQPQSCTVGALPPPNPMLMGHVLDTDWM